MNDDEILKLAKRYQDAIITDRHALLGFEFSIASTVAFYTAAFNAGLEAGAKKVIESPGLDRYGLATAIRALKEEK